MRIIGLIFVIMLVSCKEKERSKTDDSALVPTEIQHNELEIYDFQGFEKFLSTTSDKTYVINFWATWCAPCIQELPYFELLNSGYADKNVEVILLSLDFPKKFESNLKPFIKEKNLNSKVMAINDVDFNSWIRKVSEDWTGAIPATLIFNKDKRQFYEKPFTYVELENEVKQFIK